MNFFHSIANILLSPHFYACHLFVTRGHFTANNIAHDDGIRNGKLEKRAEILNNEKNNVLAAIDRIGRNDTKSTFTNQIGNESIYRTNIGVFIASGADDARQVFDTKTREAFDEKKTGIKFNMFGVEVFSLRFEVS